MGIYKQRSQYYRRLAALNKKIAHGVAVNGELRQSFFRLNNEQELTAALLNYAHFPCMVHTGFYGRYVHPKNALAKRKHNTELFFLSKVDNMDSIDEIEDAYDEAFEVMEEVMSKMHHEFEEKIYCSFFDNLDLSRFNYTPVQIGNLFGWALAFEDDRYSDVTRFDDTKWFEEI